MIIIQTPQGPANIIEKASELPEPKGEILYADFETDGFYPYLKNRSCGLAFAIDNGPAYYIPYRHTNRSSNIQTDFLKDLFKIQTWVNHNIKFDAHFLFAEGIDYQGEFRDTLTAAKLQQSDRLNYELKPLCREWLKMPMEEELKLNAYLNGIESKNYADAPVDILGEYACMDVYAVRELIQFLDSKRDKSLNNLWETEKKMTRVLYNMEKKGMRVNPTNIKVLHIKVLRKVLAIQENLQKLIGREYVDSAKSNQDLFINQFGLPVLEFTEIGAPSFTKEVMKQYTVHPDVLADSSIKKIVDMVVEYRKEAGFISRYLEPYQKFVDDKGYIHPSYNQVIRTGRMSCREPNMQGVEPRARELIIPSEGKELVSCDASQVEFRLMVHYMNNQEIIKAYHDDPSTDFHNWVMSICKDIGLRRSQAKNLNFAIGYGAGKTKVIKMLSGNPDVMDEIGQQIIEKGIGSEMRNVAYQDLCKKRSIVLYETYHERIPVKRIANIAQRNCVRRGYTFNLYGRRRHLPVTAARKAFNTTVQGGAMDYIKERMVEIAETIKEFEMIANVHDELLFEAEPGADTKRLKKTLETPSVYIRVPMLWDVKRGKNWRIAAGK